MSAYLPIGTEKRENKTKKETEMDEVLVKLKNVILQEWPDERTKMCQLYSFLTINSHMK